ncbi:MAG: hypothetical protein IRZ03_13635 [Acidobacterium ailaaui]|nr:hypothetical protein [Pseudacidobacterium ailaaui]
MSDPGPGGLLSAPQVPSSSPSAAEVEGRLPKKRDTLDTPYYDSPLVAMIMKDWQEAFRARAQNIDARLIACLRARRAQYDPELLSAYSKIFGGAQVPYLPIAALKMRAAEASILELVLPVGENPWNIEPSPNPQLSPEVMEKIAQRSIVEAQQAMQQIVQAGGNIQEGQFAQMVKTITDRLYDDEMREFRKEAEKRADRMRKIIEDHLRQGNYYNAMQEFVTHLATFPTAVLKGPVVKRKRKLRWVKKGDTYEPEEKWEEKLWWEAVNPFDLYPAPQADSPQKGFFIERMRFTRDALYDTIELPGYRKDAILSVLEKQNAGFIYGWLNTDAERRHLEGETGYVWKPTYLIDALHYWNRVQGRILLEYGLHVDDPETFYDVEAILIDTDVVYLAINDDPYGKRPYFAASFDRVPGSFWGNALYELMADSQSMINAAARALNVNLGFASGPIIGMDLSKIAAGQEVHNMRPFDTIQLDTSRSNNQDATKALIFWQADDRIPSLSKIMELFYQLADDLTNIPRYMYGNQNIGGAGATASGLSMLLGSTQKGIRKIVQHIDENVVKPTIEMTYAWEMMYGEDDEAKGDANVTARGSMQVIAREHMLQQAVQFLQIASNPQAMQIIGVKGLRALISEIAKLMDMEDIVPTEEELEVILKQQAPPQPSPDSQLRSQTELEREKIRAQATLQAAQMKLQDTAQKLASHERQTGAKVAGKLMSDRIKQHEDQALGQAEGVSGPAVGPNVPGVPGTSTGAV